MTGAVGRLAPVALWLAAAGYFAVGCRLTLEWFDEAQIVYPSWRVAQGAIPYREFQQLYGPSVFFLNGALFHLFGVDLLVLRVGLVVLKACTAVCVYLGARRMASPVYALAVYLLTLAVWGTPWWVFNTPYASHYALTASVVGLLLFHGRGGWQGAVLAGLCFGVATTFKQTSGLCAVLAVIGFVSWEAGTIAQASHAAPSPARDARVPLVLRLAAVLTALALSIVFIAPRNTAWNTLALGGPLGLSLLWAGWRDLRSGRRAVARPGVPELAGLAVGVALPLAAYAVYYAGLGLLGALVFNTVAGLPQHVQWLAAVPVPDARTILLNVAVFCGLLGVRYWAVPDSAGRRRRGAAMALLGVAAAAGGGWGAMVVGAEGVVRYVREDAWIGDVFRIVFALPWVIVGASLVSVFLAPPAEWPARRAAALFHFFAAANLLLLYPAADFWHVVMVLPAFFPSLALQLERLCRGARPGSPAVSRVRLPHAAVAAALCVFVAPFAHAIGHALTVRPADAEVLPRASRITDATAKFRSAPALLRALHTQPPETELAVIGEGQMLQFLAARRSALEQHEYAFYLVAADWLRGDSARALAPEAQVIARLEATRPIIVTSDEGPFLARFRASFGRVAAYIDAHYQVAETIGPYRVLTWRAP